MSVDVRGVVFVCSQCRGRPGSKQAESFECFVLEVKEGNGPFLKGAVGPFCSLMGRVFSSPLAFVLPKFLPVGSVFVATELGRGHDFEGCQQVACR